MLLASFIHTKPLEEHSRTQETKIIYNPLNAPMVGSKDLCSTSKKRERELRNPTKKRNFPISHTYKRFHEFKWNNCFQP